MPSALDSPTSPIGGSSNSPFFGGRAKSYGSRGGLFGSAVTTCASLIHFLEARHSRMIRIMAGASVVVFLIGMWSFYSGTDSPSVVVDPPSSSIPPISSKPISAFDLEYHTPPPAFPAPPGSNDSVLIIKTGAQVLWQRLPIHLLTTTTNTPNFLVFSDLPEYIGTTPVHDCLRDVDPKIREEHRDFNIYRQMRDIRPFPGFHNEIGEAGLKASTPKTAPYNLEIAKMGLDGGWDLDKYKNVPILYQTYRAFPNKHWYVFIDADSYIFWGNLLRHLNQKYNWKDALYLGSETMLGNEIFAHGGTGYVISYAAAKKAVIDHPEMEHNYEDYATRDCCGDHVVSRVMNDIGVKLSYERGRFQGEPWYGVRWDKGTWCSKILTFHHVGQADIQELWEFERTMQQVLEKDPRNDGYIIYGDLYHRFVKPFLTSKEDRWDNLSNDRWFEKPGFPNGFSDEKFPTKEDIAGFPEQNDREKWTNFYNWKDGEREAALASDYQACQKVCNSDGGCLQWKWQKGRCVTNHSVIFGSRDKKKKSEAWVSGWILDRVDEVRKEQSCEKHLEGGFPTEEKRKKEAESKDKHDTR